MAFQLVQILDVNEKAQTIKTIVWLTYVSSTQNNFCDTFQMILISGSEWGH